jgi:hypothetical protein
LPPTITLRLPGPAITLLEAVLTLSHPKCVENMTLAVVITPRNTPEIIIDKKEVTGIPSN